MASLPPVVTSLLRNAAPTVLAALSVTVPPWTTIASTLIGAAIKEWLPPEVQADLTLNKADVPQPTVIDAIQKNATDPGFLDALKRAEWEVAQFEAQKGIKFAELDASDRANARALVQNTDMARPQFYAAMAYVTMNTTLLLAVIIGCVLVFTGTLTVDPNSANVVVASFGLIGTVVGFVNGYTSTIISFYWGSSQSSQNKTDQITTTMRDLGGALADAAKNNPGKPVVVTPPVVVPPVPLPSPQDPATGDGGGTGGGTAPQPKPPNPAVPAPPGMVLELLGDLMKPHKYFADGCTWALTPQGISVDGAAAKGTPGDPVTARKLWAQYGALMQSAARQYGVPVELIASTALVESRGDATARRGEPKINDQSVGLMQTLVKTARMALGQPQLQASDLLDPRTSILAGAAYIAQQRGVTHFDPPLVAAAYNAGSIRRDSGAANRWKLLVYPTGTGEHLDRFVPWFNDCCRVAAEDGWANEDGVPSFVAAMAASNTGGTSTENK